MGGDNAPGEIVTGALAAAEAGIDVLLVGDKDLLGDTGNLEVLHATEVIDMEDEAGSSVRTKKDSSLVRAAEAVRDGRASAMVSAGNTGATMASALLRMGRLSGVARPAIATVIPVPGSTPTVLLDSGANADCQPQWLVQFGQMGAVFSKVRFGVDNPRVALLSIGEEDSKGNQLVKETHKLLRESKNINFIGNVEGRDFLRPTADVVVTDGFTGNVILKTLEGGVGFIVETLVGIMKGSTVGKGAGLALKPKLKPLLKELDPTNYGGAILLGVDGVCIISHGSSSAKSITSAISVARDMVNGNVVDHLREAVKGEVSVSS